MVAFDCYIKAKGIDYDSENVTFTGYVLKFNTPQFKVFKQSGYD